MIKKVLEYGVKFPLIDYNRSKNICRLAVMKEFSFRFIREHLKDGFGEFTNLKFGFTEARTRDGKEEEIKMEVLREYPDVAE